MILNDLIEFGLTEKEAKTYLALLELETASVNEISKKAHINRSSAYVTLESLKNRGLVGVSDDKVTRQYVASSPDVLLRSSEQYVQKQQNICKKIESAVPEMKSLYKGIKKKPTVRVFEGKIGIMNAFEDALISRDKHFRVMSAPLNLGSFMPEYLPKYVEKRIQAGIRKENRH